MFWNEMKWNSVLRKNRDVYLLLRLVKAFNSQWVIFRLRKVWKNSGIALCSIFNEAYIPSPLHESLIKSPKVV